MEIYVGIGFRDVVTSDELKNAVLSHLKELSINSEFLRGLCTVDFRVNEQLQKAAKELQVAIYPFIPTEINSLMDPLSKSAATAFLGLRGVAEPSAILMAKKRGGPFEIVSRKPFGKKIVLSVVKCYP